MYPYHEVLSLFTPDIEFYCVDLKPTPDNNPYLTLTVLTSQVISRAMQADIEASIQCAMTNEDCKRLALDLGWPDPITHLVLLHVEVRYFGEAVK